MPFAQFWQQLSNALDKAQHLIFPCVNYSIGMGIRYGRSPNRRLKQIGDWLLSLVIRNSNEIWTWAIVGQMIYTFKSNFENIFFVLKQVKQIYPYQLSL